jgi:dTDP-4-amino-4,6-dideoxygalactose transaminase
MWAVMQKVVSDGPGCAFVCPMYTEQGGAVEYKKGDCPVADDLYDRVVNINLNQWYTEEDCDELARRINEALSHHCTEDESAAPWL